MSLPPISSSKRYRVERSFGVTVGIVFALFGAWWMVRGKFHLVAPWALGLGGLLVLFGLVAPRVLVLPNRAWMAMAEALSFVMTRVILLSVFFLVVTPIGFVKRVTGWDPLRRRGPRAPSYWTPYPDRQRDPRHYERMF